ncbi:MAG: hypothetical protein IJE14_04710 [Clostridia bacterium]|nr:hypothetical protein [Clostridia bacterium]
MRKNKKTAKIAVSLVLVVAIIAAAVIFVKRETDNRYKAVIMDVATAPITQTLSTTGTVESTNRGEFVIYTGVVVKDVFVKLGDKVEEGQLLATFDSSSLNGIVAVKQGEYDAAKVNYYNSVAAAQEAAAKIPALRVQIAEYEKQIEQLTAASESKETEAEEQSAPAWVDSIDYSKLASLLRDEYTEQEIRDFFAKFARRGASRKSISDIIDSLTNAGSLDMSSLMGISSEESELMSAQLNVMSLKAQIALLETQSKNVLGSTYESMMNTAKANLDSAKAAVKELENGWYAQGSGIVSELNIVAGQAFVPVASSGSAVDINTLLGLISGSTSDVSGLLSSFMSSGTQTSVGLAVEYYDSFIASFSLGKADVLDVQVGKAATIESLGKEYEGEVTFISPVATAGSALDISSMLGSMTGGSTTGSNTIPAQVLIKNPDERIIIGVDVNIDIIVDTVENAVVVPIEAVETSSVGSFVYKFNEEDSTVTRVEVEIGLASDSQYQIVEGLSVGDKIVQNQSSDLQEIAEEGKKVAATPYEIPSDEAAV